MLKYLFVPAPVGTHAPLLWLKRSIFLTLLSYCLLLTTVLFTSAHQTNTQGQANVQSNYR